MKPNLFIIGAQKAASTFIHEALNRHSKIYIKSNEEPFFENPDYQIGSIEKFENDLNRENKNDNIKYLGIKRPNYLGKKEVPKRLHKNYPNSKIIVILRNPIDRAISAYFHYIRDGFIPIENVEKGFEAILSRKYEGKYPRSREIIEFGFYGKCLERYLNFFKKEQVHIILFDDIKRNPKKVLEDLSKFLEIDKEKEVLTLINKKRKPQKVVYSLKRLRLLLFKNNFLAYNKDKSRLYTNKQSFLKKAIYYFILAIDRYIFDCIFDNKKPLLSKKLNYKLKNVYRDDLRRLSKLTNKDFSKWGI